jgi:hypothetical protein
MEIDALTILTFRNDEVHAYPGNQAPSSQKSEFVGIGRKLSGTPCCVWFTLVDDAV